MIHHPHEAERLIHTTLHAVTALPPARPIGQAVRFKIENWSASTWLSGIDSQGVRAAHVKGPDSSLSPVSSTTPEKNKSYRLGFVSTRPLTLFFVFSFNLDNCR